MPRHLTALVLAAGRSSRMGARNKLLLPVRGRPMVRHVLDLLLRVPVDDLIVVAGHERDRIEAAVAGTSARLVFNPQHASGMGTSLGAGIEAARPDTDGFVIALGDLPCIRVDTVRSLVEAFYHAPEPSIVIPVHGEENGHPVLFHRAFASDLSALTGDRGGRSVVRDHPEAVLLVPTADPGILRDIDTPDAYDALSRDESGDARPFAGPPD